MSAGDTDPDKTDEIALRVVVMVRSKQPDKETSLSILLAEYGALKTEVGERVSLAFRLMIYNLTIMSTIGTLVISEKIDRQLMLIMPPVSAILALYFLDNYRAIVSIGLYLRNEIGSKLRSLAGDPDLVQWEERWTAVYRAWPTQAAAGLPWLLALAGPAVAAIVITNPPLNQATPLPVWWMDVTIFVVASITCVVAVGRFTRPYIPVRTKVPGGAPEPSHELHRSEAESSAPG